MRIKVEVVGAGYIGLPLAIELAHQFEVRVSDSNKQRVAELNENYDRNLDVPVEKIMASGIQFCSVDEKNELSSVYIVTVPTPIDDGQKPDLSALKSASHYIGAKLKEGDLVVYESTVFPGATNEICKPILETSSGLKTPANFGLGYSPERLSPGKGGKEIREIVKVVSANSKQYEPLICEVYGIVSNHPLHLAPSIEVAEFSKVLENTQRDLNIALINEVSHICKRLDVDTTAVLDAAKTKWNFLSFEPGFVGGHCIGVDPYYLLHKAERLGYMPELITAGRRINEKMPDFVGRELIKKLTSTKRPFCEIRVCIYGATFKENCPDLRNSKVKNLYQFLCDYNIQVDVVDPYVDLGAGVDWISNSNDDEYDAVVIAVQHSEFVEYGEKYFASKLRKDATLDRIFDLKNIFGNEEYWSL